MPPQHMTIKPPLGGVVESTGLEDQPAGTCSYAMNCWPSDAEQRARLSSRPGITSFATGGTTSPGSLPVRMMSEVNFATATETTRYLVASSGGSLYTLSSASGGWSLVDSTMKVSADNPLQAAPFGNRLYIADWDEPTTATSGTAGVLGGLKASGTSGVTMPGFLSTMASSGDSWVHVNGSNHEYGYDLGTHAALGTPAEPDGPLTGEVGVRFDGIGSVTRTGITLPEDGKSAVWYANLGPWEGDALLFAGIGDGSGGGVPSEYALGYDADIDRVYAYIGGSLVTLGSGLTYATVARKTHCQFKIVLTNSSGTITAVMTITDLHPDGDGELLSHTATRAYTSSTLSSEIRSDKAKKIYVDEVGYYGGAGSTTGTISDSVGSLTDSSVTDWEDTLGGAGVDLSKFLVVITGKQDGTSTTIKGAYGIDSIDTGDASRLHLTLATPLIGGTGLRWFVVNKDTSAYAGGNIFLAPGFSDWDSSFSDNRILRITSPSSHAGFWRIVSAESDKLTVSLSDEQVPLDEVPGDYTQEAQWCIPRTAKIFDLETRTLSRWGVAGSGTTTPKGNVPHGSKMIATWQDRMVLGNDQVAPHVWHMSRNGSPDDFLYGSEDVGSAVAGTNFQAGLIGEPLTALISHNKACLLMGGKDSVWVLRGDPMQGGYIERLSDDIGVLGPWAHCKTDKDATFFLSHLGLYAMPSGCGEVPTPVSSGRLPKTGPKFWSDTAQIGFDGVNNGLIVATSPGGSKTYNNFWYDLEGGGWWPFSLNTDTGKFGEVMSLFAWQPAAGRDETNPSPSYVERSQFGSLLIGCKNGSVCQFSALASQDGDGSTFDAKVRIGPINFTPSPSLSAMVQEMRGIGVFGDGATSTQRLYVGQTASNALHQSIYETSLAYVMTWGADYNEVTDNPRMSGHSLVLVIEGVGGDWAFEEAALTILPSGKAR